MSQCLLYYLQNLFTAIFAPRIIWGATSTKGTQPFVPRIMYAELYAMLITPKSSDKPIIFCATFNFFFGVSFLILSLLIFLSAMVYPLYLLNDIFYYLLKS